MLRLFKKKYTLTNKTIERDGITLHRIRALRDIPMHGVKAGDIGGYVQGYYNLSQRGSCWVSEEGKVYDYARVKNNAIVRAGATLFHSAKALGNSRVYGDCSLFGNAKITGTSEAYENARIHEFARIKGHSLVHGSASICGDCLIVDSNIREDAEVYAKAVIIDSDISGGSTICGQAYIYNERLVDAIRFD